LRNKIRKYEAKADAKAAKRNREEQAALDKLLASMQTTEAEKSKSKKKIHFELPQTPTAERVLLTPIQGTGTVKTELGTTGYTQEVWLYEVTDLERLIAAALSGKEPRNLIVIEENGTVIRNMIANGTRKIEGVEIWMEKRPVTKTK
jgi:hypothetical protein